MADSPKKLGKLTVSDTEPRPESDETVEAIFKVRQPDYVPSVVTLRARIDATMFTGTLPARDLEVVRADPKLESVEVSKRLRIVD